MFTTLLIANRGEIACRVIRTARRMGIATVAVYSAADANARHVRLADEAIFVGPTPPRESYLVTERILEAAARSGAQAIHPGYGFLSENADFATACESAGIVFVGPPAQAIRAMGSKSAAKALLETAGVPLTPGYHGKDQSPDCLARQAHRIGYPLLIKASAGGGGKGMRRVDAPEDFEAALAACQREAANAFGDDRVLLEQYILRPRHIEVQVFADRHGSVLSLFERDCSTQRRHQKILEEAPAPGITAERRAAMSQAARDVARAVGYVGAGTVEFIAHQDGSFYFMEMNTRLQVEHPVTEMITGLDLVEWQLRVAAGEPLPLTQDQLAIDGHAIEARICAEDPAKGFLPSTGRLIHLAPPPEGAHVRVDTGVEQGDEITPHYDPMIAKLIVHGRDREQALARLAQALARYRVVGVATNIELLARLISTASFRNADLDTGLIERERAALFPPQQAPPDEVWLLAASAELAREAQSTQPGSPWAPLDQWRLNGSATRTLTFRFGTEERQVRVDIVHGRHELSLDGQRVVMQAVHERAPDVTLRGARERDEPATMSCNGELHVQLGDRHWNVAWVGNGEMRSLFAGGRQWVLSLVDPLHIATEVEESRARLTAPMPGRIIALLAQAGATIAKGAPVLAMEAMKMEHVVRAPHRGIVKAFRFAPGDQVTEGAELVDFEAAET